jgi:hypothetical protein
MSKKVPTTAQRQLRNHINRDQLRKRIERDIRRLESRQDDA